MLKKLLILSLCMQLAGFTPILASQEPASNSWGFGTFLAAGAALVGGFKLALWGAQKYQDLQQRTAQARIDEQKAAELAELNKWGQAWKQYYKTNIPKVNVPVAQPSDCWSNCGHAARRSAAPSLPAHTWLEHEWHAETYNVTGRFAFLAQDLESARHTNIQLTKERVVELNTLVARTHIYRGLRRWIAQKDYHHKKFDCTTLQVKVPFLEDEVRTKHLKEFGEFLVCDVSELCADYAADNVDELYINKRKLMLAISSLDFRDGVLVDKYGIRCTDKKSSQFTNLAFEDYKLDVPLQITASHNSYQPNYREWHLFNKDGKERKVKKTVWSYRKGPIPYCKGQ